MSITDNINPSLEILDEALYDNTVESLVYTDYAPQSQANLDNRGTTIKIEINAGDSYVNTSKSYLVISGQLVQNNNNPFDANAQIALVNNAMMYLFSEIEYRVGNTQVETIRNPGQLTSMLGYLSQPDDYNTCSGLKSCWSKDTTIHANSNEFSPSVAAPAANYTPAKNPEYNQGFATRRALLMAANPHGTFQFIIPFDHIFGFGAYNKYIYGAKHALALTRKSSDNLAIHRANGVPDGKINLTNITWRVPQAQIEPSTLTKLRDVIVSKRALQVAYPARTCESATITQTRSYSWQVNVTAGVEKPRWVIVGFQTAKDLTQEQNPAVFDHLNLTNAYVTLGGAKYPLYDLTNNFARHEYSILYEMFDNFKKEYHGVNSLVGGTQVNFASFKSLFPIIVFDVRHQSEKLKTGVVDMRINFSFGEVVPANTNAYAIIISDREYKLKSDGKNATMVAS
jgi:hypothetical protein